MKHKRFLSFLIVLTMCMGLLPTTAFAYVYYGGIISSDVEESQDTILLNADTTIAEGVTFALTSAAHQYINVHSYVLTNYGTITKNNSDSNLDGGTFYNYGVCEITVFYDVTIYDLTLSSIALSSGTLSPSFAAGTREYAVTVDNSVTSIDITPTLNTGTGVKSMTVNGTTATSGAASTVSLSVGVNSIPIVITANDGSDTTNTYTLTVTSCSHSTYENGICTVCGAYEPATLNSDGVYEIANAGQLFWFASLVSGDTTQEGITAANTGASAVLMTDITIPSGYEWTPIGTKSAPYTGTFDGNGKTISGMSITTASTYMGLFGYVSAGKIKDLTVSGAIDVSGNSLYAGGIVGTVSNGMLSNLTSEVSVTANDGKKGTFGGVAATVENGSTMELCTYTATVKASGVLDCVGGLVGYMNAATITNCLNKGKVDTSDGTAAASAGIYTGGIIAYINNANAIVTNCLNYGTISGVDSSSIVSYTGAIVGRINQYVGEVSNCYYLSSDNSTIVGVGGNGNSSATVETTAQTAAEFATGAAAWSLQDANTDYVWGQDLTSDAYPILTSEDSKKVVKVTFYKSTTGIVLMESYTNADGTLSSYLTGSEYTFYSDFDLENEISGIGSLTFDTDTDIYVVTDHDLIITETNGDTIREGTNYTYDDNLLTVLTGGNYTIRGTSTTDTIKVTSSDDVAITLADVSITNGSKPPMEITGMGTVTVKLSGTNTLKSTSSANAGLQLSSADLIITSADGDGKTTGSLDATGGTYGAGIGSGDSTDMSGSITINGGTVSGTSTYGAGIGGGNGMVDRDEDGNIIAVYGGLSGSIAINGGIVSGTSKSDGAGIGSGKETDMSGSITITGGTVSGTATGYGAGIGGGIGRVDDNTDNGLTQLSGSITITGGTITAQTSNNGAGIGIGMNDTLSGDINISGGYIAASSLYGDAIGIAAYSYGMTDTASINITGGYFADSGYSASTVYNCTVADGYSAYANTDAETSGTYPCYVAAAHTHSYDTDGFCTVCGAYEPADYDSENDVYEIGNAGQLFWFASLVNGDTTQEGITAAVSDANGILTADIDLESKEWTPIGDYAGLSISYTGTFDGYGHTVKGLYINSSSDFQGLFGYVYGGTVQNVTVSGSVTGSYDVGIVVGYNETGTIINCSSSGEVSGSTSVGGIVGCNSYSSIVEYCINSGEVSGTDYVGGVVGYNDGSSIVEYCINSGEVSGTDYVGGVVGSNSGTVEYCINSGEVSGSFNVGGVVGLNNYFSTLSNSYSTGIVTSTGDTPGGVVGCNYSNTAGTLFGTVKNCYYLSSTASAGIGTDTGSSENVAEKTTTEFASGEVTYLLTGGVTNGTQAWYQNLDNSGTADSYPVLDSSHGTVYCGTLCDNSVTYYSNSVLSPIIHVGYDENGFCACGGYQPATQNSEGIYEISNAGQLFWFAALVNGDTTQEGVTAANTSANAVLATDINLDDKEWTPIATKDAPYKGTFDGGSYTVSGLSVTTAADTTEAVYVGLFGYINAGTVKNLTVSGEIDVSGKTIYAGGIVGTVHNSVLSNLTSNVDVTAEATVKGTFGGLAASVEGTGDGSAHSTMERCVNYGQVRAKGVLDCVGGLTGFMNSATITNSANYGKVDTTGGTAAASAGIYTGGIVSYINNANAVVTNSLNLGEISGVVDTSITTYTGAIVGRINKYVSEVSNCYYLTDESGILVGVAANGSNVTTATTATTTAQLASGEIAHLLQNGASDPVWGQNLTSDSYPILSGAQSDKVIKIAFVFVSDASEEYEYVNYGCDSVDYPKAGNVEYAFYTDAECTSLFDTKAAITEDVIIYIAEVEKALGVNMVRGAQIRIGAGVTEDNKTGSESGLRFIAYVDIAGTLAADASEVGIAVYDGGFGSKAEVNEIMANLTADDTPTMTIKADKYQNETVFTAAIVNIDAANYNRAYIAVPYVIVDGVTHYDFTQAVARSPYQVAAGLLVDNETTIGYEQSASGETLTNVLNAYANETGARITLTYSDANGFGVAEAEYSNGAVAFFTVECEPVTDDSGIVTGAKLTLKGAGEDVVFYDYWDKYIRINNNNSSATTHIKNAEISDDKSTLTFEFYLQ